MGLKENIYVDLKNGDRITLRNGDVLSYDEYYDRIVNDDDSRKNYTDTLRHKTRKELDIVEIKRPIEYATIFTEDDRKEEDEEIDVDEVLNKISEKLNSQDLKKGTTIIINL